MRRIVLAAAALAAAPLLAGCQTVRTDALAGLGTGPTRTDFHYTAGRSSQTFVDPPATVQPALLGAMEDLRITDVSQANEGGVVYYRGTTADRRKAAVSLLPQPTGATKVTSRIGTFGDEALSRALMDRVAIRLGSKPAAAVPEEPPSTPGSNPFFSREAVSDSEMLRDKADALSRGQDAP